MSNKTTTSGTSLFTLLTILFIALKLCHVIDWSWWWVLSPIWIVVVIAILLGIFIGIIKYLV